MESKLEMENKNCKVEGKNKRIRATNWLDEDKLLLKELVKERATEIENKNTDTNTNRRKKKAWSELEEVFNNMCHGSKKTLSQLKSQWTITKVQAKKEVAAHRRELNKTGGGTQPVSTEPSADDISVWLPNEFVVVSNEFDSDVVIEIPPATVNSTFEEKMTEEEIEPVKENTNVKIIEDVPKKKKKNQVQCVAVENIKQVVDFYLKCREELHHLQVLNEQKKARNLDMEFKVLAKQYEILNEKAEVSSK